MEEGYRNEVQKRDMATESVP